MATGVVVAVLAFTIVVLFIGKANGIEFFELSRDPASVLDGPNWVGLYANVTILIWQIGAMAALFAAAVVRHAGRRAEARMLLLGGLIGAVMGIDDFFLLHETLRSIGAPEQVPPLIYMAAVVSFAWFYRRRLGIWLLLVLGALGGWGISAVVDSLKLGLSLAVEDGGKMLGAAFWSALLVEVAYRGVTECIERGAAADDGAGARRRSRAGDTADDRGDDLGDDPDDELDDLHDEDLAAPPPAAPPRRQRVARTPVDDLATTPIPVAARPPARHGFTESPTVVAGGVRRPAPGRRRGERPDDSRRNRVPAPDRSNGHSVPVPRNGRARHRSDDD